MARHWVNCEAWWKRGYYCTIVQHNLLPLVGHQHQSSCGLRCQGEEWTLVSHCCLQYHLLVHLGRKESQFITDLRCRAVFLQLYVCAHPNWPTSVKRQSFLVADGPRDPLLWLVVISVPMFGTEELPLWLKQHVLYIYSVWSCVQWGQDGFSMC